MTAATCAGSLASDPDHEALSRKLRRKAGPGTRTFRVMGRVVSGTWDDGFIHAGNLAYMSLLSLFPFFI